MLRAELAERLRQPGFEVAPWARKHGLVVRTVQNEAKKLRPSPNGTREHADA